jgi:hypothetical protein
MYVSMVMQENIAQKGVIKIMIVRRNTNPMRRMSWIKSGGRETMPFVIVMKHVDGVRNAVYRMRIVCTIIYGIAIKTKVDISGQCYTLPFHATMSVFV